ncbi:65-kda microtubule-associated protein 6 [Phtheirospermum japonicum]|uniref:65-kDa microtubule-associated protein 6 n=1 Tax=Phtheirospermum japonicum TaxID=374723 RepID=A0A830D9Z6_9LAMI|nr:65-kda microtubule-associated protein 6 [Phtheirospermum japonicum]
MLSELERECLKLYQKKVDEAANAKARLHQSIAAKEAEIATLMATLGEINVNSLVQFDKKAKSLKGQLAAVTPLVDDLKLKKAERMKQFADIKSQIDKISGEISGCGQINVNASSLDEEQEQEQEDLSLRKLMEYQSNLRSLQKDKSERLQKILDYVNEVHTLSNVLNLDFGKTVSDVHPSLHGSSMEHVTNIGDGTLEGLEQAILRLKTERKFRFQKLKDVVGSLYELWNLMDVPKEETVCFLKYTSVLGLSESEIVQPGALSMEAIEQVSAEVERLTKLKTSRLKEIVMKKRSELEDLCCKSHIQPDSSTTADKTNALIDSGLVDPCELLANIESQIYKVKDEALSRKDIMDKIERWLSACDEEKWLEDYGQDENRYSAGRGAHINLKRAERARITVHKIPVIVDNLIKQTLAWENDKHKLFLYDGVRLVSILEDYKKARQHKEEEKKRARDQKKLQDMMLAEKESIYGSKPSPRRSSSFRKPSGYRASSLTSNNNNSNPSTPRHQQHLLTPRSYSYSGQNGYFSRLSTGPLNFVAIPKEDTISTFSSVCGSEPESPPLG